MIALPVGRESPSERALRILGLVAFAVASVSAGAVLGALLGQLGSVLGPQGRTVLTVTTATLAIAYGLAEVIGREIWMPTRHWQVPKTWAAHGRVAYAAEFGAIIGAGFVTYVPFGGYYVLLSAAAAIGDFVASGLLFGTYGVARVLPVLMAATRMNREGAMHWGVLLSDRLHATNRGLWWVRASALLAVSGAFLIELARRA